MVLLFVCFLGVRGGVLLFGCFVFLFNFGRWLQKAPSRKKVWCLFVFWICSIFVGACKKHPGGKLFGVFGLFFGGLEGREGGVLLFWCLGSLQCY